MTPDERLEKLLNRAGQTISDLPNPIDYNIEQEELAMEAAADFGSGLETYILHLTDVIDRMETALENVCGERDYLAKLIGKSEKLTCAACANNEVPLAHDPCLHCSFGIVEALKFARVPEDWRVDNETD